jgi:hypothetical protein
VIDLYRNEVSASADPAVLTTVIVGQRRRSPTLTEVFGLHSVRPGGRGMSAEILKEGRVASTDVVYEFPLVKGVAS